MSQHRILTTVVGSFPAIPKGDLMMQSYREGSDPFASSLEDAVNAQIDAGIDIISDGQTRNDMVNLFASGLRGVRMKTRPVIIGKLEWDGAITLDDMLVAREIAGGRADIKGIVTGAYTMARSCTDEFYGSTEKLAYAFAEVLAQEAGALSEIAGIVQVDEPFFSVDKPEYAGELVATQMRNVKGKKALHVCGDIRPVFQELAEFKVDILDHEFAAHPELADFVAGYDFPQMLGYGCVRSDVNTVEEIREIKERVKKGLDLFGDDKLLLDPDCGLRNLDADVARGKLANMVLARNSLEDELFGGN